MVRFLYNWRLGLCLQQVSSIAAFCAVSPGRVVVHMFFSTVVQKNHSNFNNHNTQAVEVIFAGRTPVGGHHDGRPRRHWILQGGGENDDFAHGGDTHLIARVQ